jgi:hypothetical protein
MLGRMPGPRRTRVIHVLPALVLALVLSSPTAAVVTPVAVAATPGGGNSFNELTEGQGETTKTATTSSRGSSEPTTNSQTVIILALVAAVLLLIGIAFVIVRDARKVAPAGDPQLSAGVASSKWAAKQRKRRAKAKAARQQRKRNR